MCYYKLCIDIYDIFITNNICRVKRKNREVLRENGTKCQKTNYDFFSINWVGYFSMMYHDLLVRRTFSVVYKFIMHVEMKLLFAFHLKLG